MPTFEVELDDGKIFDIEADTQPTREEVTAFMSQQQQEPAQPLSFLERGKFAFGDPAGRQQFLEQRFPGEQVGQLPTGKFEVSGRPVDPEGFDIGDIADVSDEIVRLGSQIEGAALGTFGGPFGTIAGGAAGRGVGQAGVEAIGRTLGVRQEEFGEVAKDILAETALGAAGEAGGIVIKAISKPGVKFLQNIGEKFKDKFTDPAVRAFFKFTGDVENFALQRVQDKGAKIVITKENLADDALLRVANKMQGSIKDLRGKAGQVVGEQKKLLAKSNKAIDITDAKSSLRDDLIEANILDDFGGEKAKLISLKEAPRNELVEIKRVLDSVKNDKMSASEAIRLKDELRDLVKFGKEGKLIVGTNEERIIKKLTEGIDEQLGKISEDFRLANQEFSEIAGLQETLKTRLNLPAAETFIRDVLKEKFPEFPKQKLIELNRLLPKNKQFFEELSDVAAAQQFKSSTFRGIRSGIFSGIAGGVGGGFGGPLGFAKGAALGAAVSTPRAIGGILGGQQALGRGVQAGAGAIGRTVGREAVPAGFNKFGEF